MTIQRYNPCGFQSNTEGGCVGCEADEAGDYVKFEDHITALKRAANLPNFESATLARNLDIMVGSRNVWQRHALDWKRDCKHTIRRLRVLTEAANAVLRHFMPTFHDSRAVDDCLVGLAAALVDGGGLEGNASGLLLGPGVAVHGSTVNAIPLLLWCPECGERHIDVGEFATKLHHTHACQSCGMVWRPSLRHTVGVQWLPGFKDAS